MFHLRQGRSTSAVTLGSVTSRRVGLLEALIGLGLVACQGAAFEPDDNVATPLATDTAPVSSLDDTHEPALPPNVPPVEPIFGGPNPPGSSSESITTSERANETSEALTTADTTQGDLTSFEGSTAEEPATEEEPTTEEPSTGASEEVPTGEHCDAVANWDPAWSQWEDEVLELVNEVRAVGADCGENGQFGPASPLAMDPILRCSSRLHSLDMFERDYFDHDNLDGLDPFQRMEEAGFSGSYMGENIAYGQPSPEEVMDAWVDSDGHCANIMNPNYTLLGVGYYPGADSWREGKQHFWTQNFGAPRRQGGGGGGGGGFGRP